MTATPAIDTRLMKALAHPLRQQILMALNKRVASPSELAEELGEPLGNVSYHVRMLVDLDAIELVGTTPRRGALEHHYKALVRAVFDDATYSSFPTSTKRAITATNLKEIWQSVGDAADSGAFDADDVHVSKTPVTLDEQGRTEVSALLVETFDRVQDIQAESTARLKVESGAGEHSWLVMMHFASQRPVVDAKIPKSRAKRRKPAAKKR